MLCWLERVVCARVGGKGGGCTLNHTCDKFMSIKLLSALFENNDSTN